MIKTKTSNRQTSAVAYIRMSTDKQEDSPARQRAEIETLAKRKGYKILKWYEDHGLTGRKSANRPQFQKLLNDAETGEFRAILLYEQSRLSREEPLKVLQHFQRLQEAGVMVDAVIGGEKKTDDLGGQITTLVGAHQAKEESRNMAFRSLSGKLQKVRQGKRVGGKPFAFDRLIYDESGELMKRVSFREKFQRPTNWSAELVPTDDTDALEAVKFAFESVIEGKTYLSIAREINERGVMTTKGTPWDVTTLLCVLNNPVYAGVFRFGNKPSGEIVKADEELFYFEGAHDGIIDKSTFEMAQRIIKSNSRSRGATQPGRYLLSGLIKCAHCGETIYGNMYTLRGATNFQYQCASTRSMGMKEPCPRNPRITRDPLEKLILRCVKEYILCDENREKLLEAARRLAMDSGTERFNDKQLSDIQKKIRRATENLALAESPDDFSALSEILHTWRAREKQLIKKIKSPIQGMPSPESAAAIENLAEIRKNLHLANRVKLRAALQDSIASITFGRKYLTNGSVRIREPYGQIRFAPEVFTGGVISYSGRDLHPERLVYRIGKYIREKDSKATSVELARELGAANTNVHHAARQAVLLGDIQKCGDESAWEPTTCG